MHIAACDGRRLAASTLDAPVADKLALVIPSKAARELLRLLGQDAAKPQRLTVLAGENNASFTFASAYSSEVTLVSKIIDGQYPDYTKIIPPENAIATLPRAELLRCVERIGLVADDVGLEFNGSTPCTCVRPASAARNCWARPRLPPRARQGPREGRMWLRRALPRRRPGGAGG